MQSGEIPFDDFTQVMPSVAVDSSGVVRHWKWGHKAFGGAAGRLSE